jgi:PPOX class probable F420-dependent enzyme
MLTWQRALLEELRVGHLATVSADGRPHLVPVCYALLGEEIVIAVDEKPKRSGKLQRLRNIARDPRATLLVDRYDDDWQRLAWVRIDGVASIVAQGGALPAAIAALRARYRPYGSMPLEALPLIVIAVERIAAWRWTEDEV